MRRIGIFVCHCGLNIAGTIEVEKVVEELRGYPGVIHAEDYIYMCSDPGQDLVKRVIQEKSLDGIVVANCSPTLHERTFRNLAASVGFNPYQCEIANIREQCSWPHEDDNQTATQKAVKIIKSTVEKLRDNSSLIPVSVPVTKRALVIGGGITGIQAALDLADGGVETYLVERSSSIGGRMAQLSETFPTLDCPQCILTPKMTDANQNPNIHLLAYSEIEDISGYVGDFNVKIRRKSTYIDWDKCTGCSDCAQACPVELANEYDVGLSKRKAAYRPFPQAVPNKFVIDKRGIPPCRAACPLNINCQGYVALISKGKFREALALVREKLPFPGILGRVCTHPCETECKRGEVEQPISIRTLKRFIADFEKELDFDPSMEKERDQKVAVVGSGPAGLICAYDLRRKGYQVTIFEALPVAGGMLAVGIPEYRLPREVLDIEIGVLRKLGVEFKLNTPISDHLNLDDLRDFGFDAIFLAPGCHVSKKLGVPGEDSDGVFGAVEFLRDVNLGKEVRVGEKVGVIGGGNAAIDAARTAQRLGAKEVTIVYRRSRKEMPAEESEIKGAEHEGVKIHYLANPTEFINGKGKLKAMECIRMELGEPDASGRRRPVPIPGSEFVIDVDMVIPAISQSPDLAPFSKKDFQFTKWDTFVVDPDTLMTTSEGVFAGGDAVSGPATVIEALAAGRKAAESIDKYLRGEDMATAEVEKVVSEMEIDTDRVEREWRIPMPLLPVEERVRNFKEVDLGFTEEDAIREAERCLACAGCSECMECVKVCEPEAIVHDQSDRFEEVDVGAIIVATGYDLYQKEALGEFGYGKYENVIDGLQFERILSASGPTGGEVKRPSDGSVPKDVVFISCVGSRDPEHGVPYCSKVCCMYLAKQAMIYKHLVPDGQAYVFYMDIRSDGKGYEEFVQRGMEEDGILYLRGRVSKIFSEDGKVRVWGADTLTGKKIEIPADLVVLATAVVPSEGIRELASKLRIQTDEHGWLKEAHLKLRPVETLTSGIYIAGAAQSPKDITDSVAQGSGAASKVLALLSKDELLHEPTVASVDEEVCTGCGNCERICAYDAVEVDTRSRLAVVNEILCEGCGACQVACPSGAMTHRNFSARQIMNMVTIATEDYGW